MSKKEYLVQDLLDEPHYMTKDSQYAIQCMEEVWEKYQENQDIKFLEANIEAWIEALKTYRGYWN